MLNSTDIKERICAAAPLTASRKPAAALRSASSAPATILFELSSNVVERRGQISGKWSEASYGVSGTPRSGCVAGDRITAMVQGDKFNSPLSLVTTGNRQTVSLTPERTYVISVQISLDRR